MRFDHAVLIWWNIFLERLFILCMGYNCVLDVVDSEDALIFIDVERSEILQMDLATYELSSIPVTGLVNPVAIDIDLESNYMFWTDVVAKTIKRSTLRGTNELVIKHLSSSMCLHVEHGET